MATRTGSRCSVVLLLLLLAPAGWADASRKAIRPAKVRSGPGIYHAILERLDAGAELSVVESGKRWCKVRTRSGTDGWVSARVFAARPEPKGYAKVLDGQGLEGVSSIVTTMASRGLNMGGGGAAVNPLVAGFLAKVPFAADEFERFIADLPAQPICEQLPDFVRELGEQLPGDPADDARERELGLRLAGLVLADAELITDQKLDAYVNQVGVAVAAASSRYDLDWRFVVFEQAAPEAFVLPGGLVFLSSGLLKGLTDEAELAGVLAHEVAHLVLGHGLARLEGQMADGQGSPAERLARLEREALALARGPVDGAEEVEADAFGATYAACAGYDPAGLIRVHTRGLAFEKMGPQAPSLAKRKQIIGRVAEAAKGARGRSFPERFRTEVLAQAVPR